MKISVAPPLEKEFTIHMAEDELRTFAALAARVGGLPEFSRRSHTNAFLKEMRRLGIDHACASEDLVGTVDFKWHRD